jgi:hypothetical protein
VRWRGNRSGGSPLPIPMRAHTHIRMKGLIRRGERLERSFEPRRLAAFVGQPRRLSLREI